MFEKALIIIIAIYCFSTAFFVGQYVLYDVFQVEMTDFHGNPIHATLLNATQIDFLNQFSTNVKNQDFSSFIPGITSTAYVIWQIIQLMTGTYIFNIMSIFDIPLMVIITFQIIYVVLLARAIIAYVNRI